MLFVVCAECVSADIYKWTDSNGVVHFTENPPPAGGELDKVYTESKITPSKSISKERTRKTQKKLPAKLKEKEKVINLSISDISGKWEHLGTSSTVSSNKLSKPYKPQTKSISSPSIFSSRTKGNAVRARIERHFS